MPDYLISFDDEWVAPHTEEQLHAKGAASRAVLDDMRAAGVLRYTNGGIDVDDVVGTAVNENGVAVIRKGPFVEKDWHLGGFAVVEVDDDEAALYWAGRLAVALDWPQEVSRFPSPRYGVS